MTNFFLQACCFSKTSRAAVFSLTVATNLWRNRPQFGRQTAILLQLFSCLLVFSLPAQTTTTDCQAQIDSLNNQIRLLEAQLQSLQNNSPPTSSPITAPAEPGVVLPNGVQPASNPSPATFSDPILAAAYFSDLITREKPSFHTQALRLYGSNLQAFVVDAQSPDLRLDFYFGDTQGIPYRTLKKFKTHTQQVYLDRELVFATNGGMYRNNQGVIAPNGLLVSEGKELARLNNRTSGYGNFYTMPNGVFFIDANGQPGILTTERYRTAQPKVKSATQSGPMLVINNIINRHFTPASASRKIRSGVGIIDNRYLVFIVSETTINMYDFARTFRDVFGCREALFLDGTISKAYCPAANLIGKSLDGQETYGPIIGIFATQ